jgi:hypothetical protein
VQVEEEEPSAWVVVMAKIAEVLLDIHIILLPRRRGEELRTQHSSVQ